jgi:hypothetical protein
VAARLSKKKLPRYSLEFKLSAVRLTKVPVKPGKGATGSRAEATCGARKGTRVASRGARSPQKSHPVLFRAKGDVFAFIEENRESSK